MCSAVRRLELPTYRFHQQELRLYLQLVILVQLVSLCSGQRVNCLVPASQLEECSGRRQQCRRCPARAKPVVHRIAFGLDADCCGFPRSGRHRTRLRPSRSRPMRPPADPHSRPRARAHGEGRPGRPRHPRASPARARGEQAPAARCAGHRLLARPRAPLGRPSRPAPGGPWTRGTVRGRREPRHGPPMAAQRARVGRPPCTRRAPVHRRAPAGCTRRAIRRARPPGSGRFPGRPVRSPFGCSQRNGTAPDERRGTPPRQEFDAIKRRLRSGVWDDIPELERAFEPLPCLG